METKFTEDELKKVTEIRDRYNKYGSELLIIQINENRIYQQLENLQANKGALNDMIKKLVEEETTFTRDLQEKYGVGTLNLHTGIFTSE